MLTDIQVKNATVPPGSKLMRLSDGEGLAVIVTPKSKRFTFEYTFRGKRRSLSLGVYPRTSIKAARVQAQAARDLLADGKDPSSERRAARVAGELAAAATFEAVATDWLKRRTGLSTASHDQIRRHLVVVNKTIGKEPVDQITPALVLLMLRKPETAGFATLQRKRLSLVGRIMRHATRKGLAKADPTASLAEDLNDEPATTHHRAIMGPERLGDLLRALDTHYDDEMRLAWLLLLHLYPRKMELMGAAKSEFNLAKKVWVLPAARTKTRREMAFPLSRQVVSLIDQVMQLNPDGERLFRNRGDGSTLRNVLKTIGFDSEHTPHGCRSSAGSILNEHTTFSSDAIELSLGHVLPGSSVRRSYVRSNFWQERVRIAQWWSDALDSMQNGTWETLADSDNVVAFKAGTLTR